MQYQPLRNSTLGIEFKNKLFPLHYKQTNKAKKNYEAFLVLCWTADYVNVF